MQRNTKFIVKLESNRNDIAVPQFIDHVNAVKIRWLNYKTATNVDTSRFLSLKSNLNDKGKILLSQGNNSSYFMSVPIDNKADVDNNFANFFANDFDVVFDEPQQFTYLHFDVYINNILTTEVDSDHPVTFEIVFFH